MACRNLHPLRATAFPTLLGLLIVPALAPAADSFHAGPEFVFCDYEAGGTGDAKMTRLTSGLAIDGFLEVSGCFWDTAAHPVGPIVPLAPLSHLGSGAADPWLVNHGPTPGRTLTITPDAVNFAFGFDFVFGTVGILVCNDVNDDHICGDPAFGEDLILACGFTGPFLFSNPNSVHVGVFVAGPRFQPLLCLGSGNLVGGVQGQIFAEFS